MGWAIDRIEKKGYILPFTFVKHSTVLVKKHLTICTQYQLIFLICRIFICCSANLLINQYIKMYVWNDMLFYNDMFKFLFFQARCWLSRILPSTWPPPRPCRRTWTCITSVRLLPASCSCPCTGHAPFLRSTFLGQFSHLRVKCSIKGWIWKGGGLKCLDYTSLTSRRTFS